MNIRTIMGLTLMCVALAACGKSSTSEEQAGSQSEAVAPEVTEAVSTAADEAEAAAEQTMAEAEDLAETAMDEAGDQADAAMDAAGEMADDAIDAAETAADEVATAAEGMAEDASEAVGDAGGECSVTVEVGDALAYSVTAMTAPASCAEFTVVINHTGKLPAAAMGHNWVLVTNGSVPAIGAAGMGAGADADYVPDDERVLASTGVVGGGESDSVTFSLEGMSGTYEFLCTFPGHWAAMRGTFTVANG